MELEQLQGVDKAPFPGQVWHLAKATRAFWLQQTLEMGEME